MSRVSLTVNGETVEREVEPRTHLADFLREDLLLTATHIGCEHGVCGACTLLIDGAPARSCIAYAVTCDGAEVRTIEGLQDDPVMERLREAFTAEHALQCGYCTPGMLVTARDIVLRLPGVDEARIRLELAGNLCRCTGYAGIVRAIQRVMAEGVTAPVPAPRVLPKLEPVKVQAPTRIAAPSGGTEMSQTIKLRLPLSAVWSAMQDPALIAACIPGARLIEADGERLRGEVRAALGPIETLFSGEAVMTLHEAEHRVEVAGEGRDARSGTRLSARVELRLRAIDDSNTEAALAIDYALRGSLAQFARGAIVREFAAEMMQTVARGLEARLTGGEAPPAPAKLSAGKLMLRVLWRRIKAMLGTHRHGRP